MRAPSLQARFFTALRQHFSSDSLSAHLSTAGPRAVGASLVRMWRQGSRQASADDLLASIEHIGPPALDYLCRLHGMRAVRIAEDGGEGCVTNSTLTVVAMASDLARVLRDATDAQSELGPALSATECRTLLMHLDDLRAAVAANRGAVKARLQLLEDGE